MYQIFNREAQVCDCKHMLVLLPGRGQPATDMLARYSYQACLKDFILVAIDPDEEWYPAPNGANDQLSAVNGIATEAPKLLEIIETLAFENNIPLNHVVLGGWSAGAVMAIECSQLAEFAAIVVHNGAILSPDNLLKQKYNTSYLVFHNENDDCFSWEERYIPMKNALLEKEYCVFFKEGLSGHFMTRDDVYYAGEWVKNILGYPTNFDELFYKDL